MQAIVSLGNAEVRKKTWNIFKASKISGYIFMNYSSFCFIVELLFKRTTCMSNTMRVQKGSV